MPISIGIDFDNTLVDYRDFFGVQAARLGWVRPGARLSKGEARDRIKALPDGDRKWGQLQGLVYGRMIQDARPFEGARGFIQRCAAENIDIYVISHKSEYAETPDGKINLRDAARGWLKASGLQLMPQNIFFEDSREGKIRRIGATGCTHFIDDLSEVLLDPDFPGHVTRILFSSHRGESAVKRLWVCPDWEAIEGAVFQNVGPGK